MAQMKEQIKAPEKNTTKRQRDSQPIRCTVQNTGNQDAHRNGWVWLQNTGKSEGYAKWNKGKCTGNQQWWEGNPDSNEWFGLEEEINIQPELHEEARIPKNEERLRNLLDNFKCSNIWVIGAPEGEEEEQEIENLFENIMKENFPNLAKEIDFQEVQEAQRVPKKLDPRKHTPKHIIIKLPKIKDKERILKAAREKERVTYKGVPIRLSANFSKENLQLRKGWKEVSKSCKTRTYIQDYSIQQSYHLELEGQIKCFPDKVKLKESIITKPLYEMLKGYI